MILNTYLNESSAFNVEATSEGYSIENDGMNQIVRESSMEIHKLKMASMIQEAKAVQMIKESGDVDGALALNEGFAGDIIEKIKSIIKKIWAKIKEFFSGLKLYISKFTMNDKKFLETYKDELQKATFDEDDVTFEGYEYSLDKISAKGAYDRMKGSIDKQATMAAGSTDDSLKEKSKKLGESDFTDTLRGLAMNSSGTLSSEEFNEEVFKALRSDKDSKEEIKSLLNAGAVISSLEKQTSAKSEIEKDEREVNTIHSDALKAVEKLQKGKNDEIKKTEDQKAKTTKGHERDVYKSQAQAYVTALSIANSMIGAKENALKEKLKQDREIAQKILVASRKKNKKIKESSSMGDDYSLDSIMNML